MHGLPSVMLHTQAATAGQELPCLPPFQIAVLLVCTPLFGGLGKGLRDILRVKKKTKLKMKACR